MSDVKTQITFAPDVAAYEELGANWYNVVLDITDYLKSQGFEYSRTLGFVKDGELSEEELLLIGKEITTYALGNDMLLYLNAQIISDIQDLTHLFKDKENA